jgi:hypothetical protein
MCLARASSDNKHRTIAGGGDWQVVRPWIRVVEASETCEPSVGHESTLRTTTKAKMDLMPTIGKILRDVSDP